MKVLSLPECSEWANGLLESNSSIAASPLAHRVFHVRDGAPAHAVLRRWVEWLFGGGPSVLILVDEYGVWESSEDLNLYSRWRQAVGAPGALVDAPGHVFEAKEADDATSLLLMARVFGWGFRALAQDGRRGVRIDHDGHGIVVAADDASLASAPP